MARIHPSGSSDAYIGPYGTCGNKCYNLVTELCCNGTTERKKSSYHVCCGGEIMDKTRYVCCGGTHIRRSKNSYTSCCGNQTYDYYKEVGVRCFDLVGCLVVFYVPSTARSFSDITPIYCSLRRM